MTDVDPPILSYGTSRRNWRRPVRFAVALAVMVAAAGLAWKYAVEPVYCYYQAYRSQSAALAYTAPPGTVAYAMDEVTDPRLPPDGRSLTYTPPPAWRAYQPEPGLCWPNVLYVGRHVSPSGNERIVVIRAVGSYTRIGPPPIASGSELCFVAYTRHPATLFAPSRPTAAGMSTLGVVFPFAGKTRVNAGRADPGDRSHFTIEFGDGTFADAVDAWLQDDDTVRLAPQKATTLTFPIHPL